MKQSGYLLYFIFKIIKMDFPIMTPISMTIFKKINENLFQDLLSLFIIF